VTTIDHQPESRQGSESPWPRQQPRRRWLSALGDPSPSSLASLGRRLPAPQLEGDHQLPAADPGNKTSSGACYSEPASGLSTTKLSELFSIQLASSLRVGALGRFPAFFRASVEPAAQ